MPANYRLLTYRAGTIPRPGVLVGGYVYPAADLLRDRDSRIDASSMLGLLQSWETVSELLPAALNGIRPSDGIALSDVTLEAPILYPSVVLATGGNYADHLDEMAKKHNRPPFSKYRLAEPFFTLKTAAHSIIGHGAPIRYPRFSKQLDYEAEIGVVIGRLAENVAESDAMDTVAGYVGSAWLRRAERRSRSSISSTAICATWLPIRPCANASPTDSWSRHP
jgi:2-keto-4-pentenoate hydratase/2-oxohepta-3-ene-1,7-dioic acid hydratase in catechol pathway